MEAMKGGRSTLRRAFIWYVALTFAAVAAASAAAAFGCYAVRARLLPPSDEVYLNVEKTYEDGRTSTTSQRMKIGEETKYPLGEIIEDGPDPAAGETKYSVTSIETNYSSLSPRRRLLYHACGVGMAAFPAVFSLAGILFCGLLFYKKRLQTPIGLLSEATEKIAGQDLDFAITAPSDDELGQLCASFESMRRALAENNRRMWEMWEERRRMQASVAHDLRNPIAIIESHAEYLRMNLPGGTLTNDKILLLAGNIENAAKRLESYTESMRTVNHLEELEIDREPVNFAELFAQIEEDFIRMAAPYGISLRAENRVAAGPMALAPQALYRILENLVGNALRFARHEIVLTFSYENSLLQVSVSDDGGGFSEKILSAKDSWFVSDSKEPEHTGIGLAVCRILCQKHGGKLCLANGENGGALVKFSLSV